MNLLRVMGILAFLAIPPSAFAQHRTAGRPQAPHGGTSGHMNGGHTNGGQMHAGGGMSFEEMFWWNEMQMMNAPRVPHRRNAPSNGVQGGTYGASRAQQGLMHDQAMAPAQATPNGSRDPQNGGRSRAKTNQQTSLATSKNATDGSSATQSTSQLSNKHSQQKSREPEHEAHRSMSTSALRSAAQVHRDTVHSSDAGIVIQLRVIHSELNLTNNDYAGHVKRSMEHVTTALHELGANHVGSSNESMGHLTQKTSDRDVRKSLDMLERVEVALSRFKQPEARHTTARTSVAEAIRELRDALAVR